MNDINILDAVEKYIRGEMTTEERAQFELLRRNNAEIDQLTVEHTLFLQQLSQFGERKELKSSLNDIHTKLTEEGAIESMKLKGKAKIVYLWKRYQRVAAIAAGIAGITTLVVSLLVLSLAPKGRNNEFDKLSGRINDIDNKTKQIDNKTKQQDQEIISVKNKIATAPISYTTWGTGFVIDPKGYVVTNVHVIENAKNVAVHNKLGDFTAKVVYTDPSKDIAILKIVDDNFKPFTSVPYTISKSSGRLAEPIFTLGYPRNEIVYGQGYLSAKTGFNGDTLSFQMDVAANWGNSGSPIVNNNGEVIGILNGRQKNVEGFSFAVQGRYIYKAIDELKKDTLYKNVKTPSKSSMPRMDRTQQVERLEDYVFMVKVN